MFRISLPATSLGGFDSLSPKYVEAKYIEKHVRINMAKQLTAANPIAAPFVVAHGARTATTIPVTA